MRHLGFIFCPLPPIPGLIRKCSIASVRGCPILPIEGMGEGYRYSGTMVMDVV